MPRTESDSTALGTSVHAGIEHALADWIAYDQPAPLDDALQVMHLTMSELIPTIGAWTKFTEERMRQLGELHVRNFFGEILPSVDKPLCTEWNFELTFHEDEERVITFAGQADCVTPGSIWDWKTATRAYKAKEKQDKAIQPTVYAWAWNEEHPADTPWLFNFGVMVHPTSKAGDGTTQIIQVMRHKGHVDWLRERAVALAKLVEAGLAQWPFNDDGWWCSQSWCGKYAVCKGRNGI